MIPTNKIILEKIEKFLDRELEVYSYRIRRYDKRTLIFHYNIHWRPLWKITFSRNNKIVSIWAGRRGTIFYKIGLERTYKTKYLDTLKILLRNM